MNTRSVAKVMRIDASKKIRSAGQVLDCARKVVVNVFRVVVRNASELRLLAVLEAKRMSSSCSVDVAWFVSFSLE